MLPAGLETGKLTFKRSEILGILSYEPAPNIPPAPSNVPEIAPSLPTSLIPQRTPKSSCTLSFTVTIRDSMTTCLTGISKVSTIRRTLSILFDVSLISKVLVRLSTDTLPRAEIMLLVSVFNKSANSSALA